ncbi:MULTISPECIES: hypothetical protein [unclassified Acinetobacter]|uniref:hypothetical protein n=1 Tax=unclassified Acinetobacter TaxID=196816 RepID=UPI00244A2E6E|nr:MULTISPECIES: hypothetical protein [unclassified Acinetobacter]MDH0032626.1 DUF2281 domain-containing protein [Acinetobacter sp. GD04021]MDH0886934.1 DUF2281 domain-containing protein [Acinetobacter sp. GD03873]MDH1083253.1 DUF2281 domain-containing protein [Acinetobacter sp. GD03983]MDH2190250.1 DUF2281 domain-containing protein [Acinetobacter sp. GD03645]MDH2203271.1 DUF2281 domain-containing protein [Acinetobacter sp. GD03647]
MGLAELVFHKVSQLPQEKIAEVLDFVQFLEFRQQQQAQATMISSESEDLIDLILAIPKIEDATVFERIQDVEMRDVFN